MRSFTAIICGTLLLPGLLLTAPAAADGDPLLARVGEREIRLSDVYRKVQQLSLADQIDVRDQLDRFTDSVIREELLFQSALRQAETDPAWREELKAIVVHALLEREVRARVSVSEEDLRAYYDQNLENMGGDHLALRHIPFRDPAVCDAVAGNIASEADFVTAAETHHSNPAIAQRGGDIGHVMRGRERLGFEEALFADDRPGLRRIDQEGLCHLLWVGERVTLTPPAFEELEAQMRERLEADRQRELLEALLATGEAEISVERLPQSRAQSGAQ